MSYLDFPRIHFAGGFTSAPSTINNPPDNYKRGQDSSTEPWDMATWWQPYGNAIFTLNPDCKVTAVQTAGNLNPVVDTLDGIDVFAGNTSSQPKIADLDPVQQNVSEWWGLNLQIGLGGSAGKLSGDFTAVAFRNIWTQSSGQLFASGSGAGVYQSVLENIDIDAGDSKVLAALKEYDALSVRMHLRSYNGMDQTYDLTQPNLKKLRTDSLKDLPDNVWKNLATLSKYHQFAEDAGKPDKCGIIYTTVFVNYLMQRWLGERDYNTYGGIIRNATPMEYKPLVTTDFTCGKLVGTIGSYQTEEPKFFTAQRNMGPTTFGDNKFAPMAPYANFQVSDSGVLSVDLVNALETVNPTDGPFVNSGDLELAFVGGNKIAGGTINNTDFDSFMENDGGIVDVQLDTSDIQTVKNTPVCVRTTVTSPDVLMEEPASGYWLRADQFVFRMNPGIATSANQPCGETNQVKIYLRQFGEIPQGENIKITLTMMSPTESYDYTNQTIGTGGTPGLKEIPIGTPANALTFEATATVEDGIATFDLTATNPGNPRQFIDGQIYFLTYAMQDMPAGYIQSPDDIVSVLVFEKKEVSNPVWTNCIDKILGQYGRLYPIMSRFGLDDYDSVKTNAAQIREVLERPITDPFHMPVTRDLSESRRQQVFTWMDSGMPESYPRPPWIPLYAVAMQEATASNSLDKMKEVAHDAQYILDNVSEIKSGLAALKAAIEKYEK
ncbi:MAG: DUF1843 domain-containing protein [Proteobacteria bacterium]|nr:DUF1843 domain-containing protein [Pseudomonadota bacterium]